MTQDSGQDGGGNADQDSPWKEALEHYLEQAMALLFPHLHERIDWSKGFLFRALSKSVWVTASSGQAAAALDVVR